MYKVLIADDEKNVIGTITKLGEWAKLGLKIVAEAHDGDSLFGLTETMRPDIVLTDMKMPGLCGAALIRKLSISYSNIKIIIISGFDDFVYTKEAISAKVVDYILKPIHKEDLNFALKNAVSEIQLQKNTILETDEQSGRAHHHNQNNLNKIRKFVDENYCTRFSLADLSKMFFWSEEYISKMFKDRFKCNLYEYIMILRIEKAKELLESDIKISELIHILNFTDESHFCKIFKRHTGMTSRDYRNMMSKAV